MSDRTADVARHADELARPGAGCLAAAAVGAVVGLAVAGYAAHRAMEPTVGRDRTLAESQVPDLPASAAHISYCLPGAFGPVKLFEFDAPPADALLYAKGRGWAMVPIDPDHPREIQRFGAETGVETDPPKATVLNGYYCEQVNPQAADDRTLAVYDADAHRLYVERSSR